MRTPRHDLANAFGQLGFCEKTTFFCRIRDTFCIEFAKLEKPLTREHIRPAMKHLAENYREGDVVYLYYFSEPAYLFYAPKYGLDEIPYVLGENHQGEPELYKSDIDALDIHGRAWFLFTHVYEVAEINEEMYITEYLKDVAQKKRNFLYPGSSVSLYLYIFP